MSRNSLFKVKTLPDDAAGAPEDSTPTPVIDMWAPIVPATEIVDDLRAGFPAEQLRYLEVFTKTRLTTEQFAAYAESLRRSDDAILAELDAAGIRLSLITGFDDTPPAA